MGFRDWVAETRDRYHSYPPTYATIESVRELSLGGLRRIGQFVNYGTPIWEREWDVLVILDACRADTFIDLYGSDSFAEEIDTIYSVGSGSVEWHRRTFDEKYAADMADTITITGNPFSASEGQTEHLQDLIEVWRYAWDDEKGTIPPEPLTDAAITTYREQEPDRMIVHYMQPHFPHVTDPLVSGHSLDEFGDYNTNTFDALKRGDLEKEAVLEAYQDNLQYVMEHLRETLLVSIDADRVVLSADHANLFGEYGFYGHPVYMLFPAVKRVPWITTTATNTGEYTPKPPKEQSVTATDSSVEDKLKDLGYL